MDAADSWTRAGVPPDHTVPIANPVATARTAATATALAAIPAIPEDATEQLTRPIRRPQTPLSSGAGSRAARPASGAGDPRFREYVEQLSPVQVVCWQVAAIAVALSVHGPWPVLAATCTCAAAVLALTAVRRDGRWLYQLAALGIGNLRRERDRDLPESGEKVPAMVDLLVPDAIVRAFDTGNGVAMTVSHQDALAALLRPEESITNPSHLPLPESLLPAELPAASGVADPVGVQLVCHAGVRRDGPPKVWFGVHAVRTVAVPDDEDLTLVLSNAMRRVSRALRRSGLPVKPLAEDAAFATLAGLAHISGGRNQIREDWQFWRTGPVCQATAVLRGIDRLTATAVRWLLTDVFAATAGVAVTVTLSARSGQDGPGTRGVLRFAAISEAAASSALATVRAVLTRHTSPDGRPVRLVRLDGRHASGVAASLPIGVQP